MGKLNGDEATKNVIHKFKIKDLVNTKGYVDCVVIGYSSDENAETISKFLKAGCNYVENKPSSFNNFKRIFD